jgi:hypothetical protein
MHHDKALHIVARHLAYAFFHGRNVRIELGRRRHFKPEPHRGRMRACIEDLYVNDARQLLAAVHSHLSSSVRR